LGLPGCIAHSGDQPVSYYLIREELQKGIDEADEFHAEILVLASLLGVSKVEVNEPEAISENEEHTEGETTS